MSNKEWAMKRKIIQIVKAVGAIALVLSIVTNGQPMKVVKAGSSDIVIDNSSFAETLDQTKWNVPNADVLVENNKIIFPAESTSDTRLLTRQPAKASKYHEEMLSADYTLKFNELPSGQQFFVAFGLANVESYYGEPGNLELVFENDGGLKASLVAYDDSGDAIELVDAQGIGVSMGQNVRISTDITSDMQLTIQFNGKTFYADKAPIDLSGRAGFLTTGSCVVEISHVDVLSHIYDQPENVNVVEDFESGSININALSSMANNIMNYSPAGIRVEEYNGSHVLMFRNVKVGYLATKYQYSNFEISFDVPYMQHNNEMNDDGTIQTPYHSQFVLSYGDEAEEYDSFGFEKSPDAITFGSTEIVRLAHNDTKAIVGEKGYYEPNSTVGYSVKMTVIDGQTTVYVKSIDALEYDQVLTYKIGNATPFGYIHFWSNGQVNFGIDNLKITNLDKDANVKEVEYKEGFITDTEDWEYEPQEVVYYEGVEEEDGFNWKLIAAVEVAAGVLVAIVCVVIATLKKRVKKEVKVNEE